MMSIFPFIDPISVAVEQKVEQANALPMYKEYAYDFERNRLLLQRGKTYLVEGNEAIKVWIYKALHTMRYRHIAYSTAYGNEASTLIGAVMSHEVLEAELQRYVTETLMVNPYISGVSNFAFEYDGSTMTVYFDCATVYGVIKEQYKQGGGT